LNGRGIWSKHLIHLVEENSLKVDKVNVWVWKENETKDFTVKSTYRVLKEEAQVDGVAMYEDIWRLKSQPSSQFTT